MNSSNTSDPATDASAPTYTRIEPRCPICGNSRFDSTEEVIPDEFGSHHVHVRCAHCKTHLTIEYRAIDLSWFDGVDEHHSAVSQRLLDSTATEYAEAANYGPLPDSDVLGALDWPLTCEECGDPLTGNDLVTDPDHAQPADTAETVSFQCLNCERFINKTPASSTSDGRPTET